MEVCCVRYKPHLSIVQRQLILWTLEDALTAKEEQKSFVIIGATQSERQLQTKTVYKHLNKDNRPFLNHIQRSVRLLTLTLTENNHS